MPLPRPLRPAEIRLLRQLVNNRYDLCDLAAAAGISAKAIGRIWTTLKHLGLTKFVEVPGGLTRGLTDAGRAALAELDLDRTLQDDEQVCSEAARESKERSAPAHMFLPTPTPWCVHKFSSNLGGNGFQLRGDKGGMTTIGSLTPGSTTDRVESISEANAAFIVRACNSHDALVAALVEVRAAITEVNRGAGETVFNPAVTQIVDAVLKLAQVQS